MPINKRKERLEKILLSLENLGFATREQLQVIHQLGKKRNANRVLQDMAPYIQIKRHPERDCCNVYYLSKQGCEKIGTDKERRYSNEVEHYLMRNDMYIHFGCPDTFTIEEVVAFRLGNKEMIIRPDACFSLGDRVYFLEVDRIQKMKVNRRKLERYAELAPVFMEQFAYPPKIVFYTETDSRKELLVKEGGKYGLDIQVLVKEEIKLTI